MWILKYNLQDLLDLTNGMGVGWGVEAEGGREEGAMEHKWNEIETHDSCAV